MDYLMIVKIGLYAFIVFNLFRLIGLIILIIGAFTSLNKNKIRYRKPIAAKMAERLRSSFYIILFIGVAVAILSYGFI